MTIIVSLCHNQLELIQSAASDYLELRTDVLPVMAQPFSPYILRCDLKPSFKLILQLAACNPKYVDVPASMPKELFDTIRTSYPHVKIIASFHDFEKTPENLEEIFWHLRSFDCDVIKIVSHAESALDGLRMLSFLQKHSSLFPLVAFCMGEKASFTRILQPVFGAVWTYASQSKNRETAAGQIDAVLLKEVYRYEKLSPGSTLFALVGESLDKSYSDLIHNANFHAMQMDAVYVKVPLIKEEFLQALPYFQTLGFRGLSVTQPLKQCFDKESPYNTVHFKEGQTFLYNTDGSGALDAIEEQILVAGKKMLIIGSGATGEAICQEALKRGAHLTIYNRTYEKAQLLAQKHKIKVLEKLEMKDFDLLVNATSADFDVQVGDVKNDAVALDVSIKETTAFLEGIQQQGGKVISGQRMWLYQAAKQLAIWCNDESVQIVSSSLNGTMQLPPSKSQTLRALLFATLAEGRSLIKNPLNSPDTEAMIAACRALGAKVECYEKTMIIEGIGEKRELVSTSIDAKNSGIVLRFVGAVLGLFSEEALIFGDETTKKRRSCKALVEGLCMLGAKVKSNQNHAPLYISGPIQSGICEIDGQDSQPVSSLLIAASLLEGTTEIRVRNPGEKPWVALTLEWLKKMGVEVVYNDYTCFKVRGAKSFRAFEYEVPGDLSSLAYPLTAALFTESELTIEGVCLDDSQGDKKLLYILQKMGAKFFIDEKRNTITVKGPQTLYGASIDCNDCIDMVTILAVIGAFSEGETLIYNAEIARDKESDRLSSITSELKKMGADIEERKDGFIVRKSALQGAVTCSNGDHRLAMALAVAALNAKGPTMIHNISCVKKSYPGFFQDLAKVMREVR